MSWWGANLRALSRHDAPLALALAQSGPLEAQGLELLRGSSGAWTARRLSPTGRRAMVHAPSQPLESAARVVDKSVPEAWRKAEPDHGVCAVLGVGLGWPALAAAARMPRAVTLLLADPDLSLFSHGMQRLDLGPLWDRSRLSFCFGEPSEALQQGAVDEGMTVSIQDGVIDAFDGGKEWALRWVRGLQGRKMRPAAAAEGLPDWLDCLVQARQRGERL